MNGWLMFGAIFASCASLALGGRAIAERRREALIDDRLRRDIFTDLPAGSYCLPSFVCENAEQPSAPNEATLVGGHGVGAAGVRHHVKVACGELTCNEHACPWHEFVRHPKLVQQVTRYRGPAGGVRKLSKSVVPEEAARANPHLADIHGYVPGVYDFDPEMSLRISFDSIRGPGTGATALPYQHPDRSDLESRTVSSEARPRRHDAEYSANSGQSETDPLSPWRHFEASNGDAPSVSQTRSTP